MIEISVLFIINKNEIAMMTLEQFNEIGNRMLKDISLSKKRLNTSLKYKWI